MIEAASQILLSVSNSNADNSVKAKNNNRDSGGNFSDIYNKSRSRSSSDRGMEESVSKRNQSEPVESQPKKTRQVASSGNEKNNRVDDRKSSQKIDNDTKSQSRPEAASEVDSKNNDGEIDNPLAEDIASDQEKTEAEAILADNAVTEDVSNLSVIAETVITDTTEIQLSGDQLLGEQPVVEQGSVENNDLDKQKSSLLAQAITAELQTSKEKSTNLVDSEKSTRSKIVSDIEKALQAPDAKENAERLAAGEKLLSQQKLIAQENAITSDKLLAQEKQLKPELAANVNATKVIGEQLSLRELNLSAAALATDGDAGAEGKEVASSLKGPTDALLEKILQRLDFGKLKAEENQLAKIATDKSSIADFVDQLSTKMSSESSVGSLLSASSVLTAKSGVTPPPLQLAMTANMNQPQWGTDFSKRIQFMINNEIKNAELRLDPPELGRITVKINLSQDQLSVSFTSANGNVRETIENTLPKLREMLQESGIQLGETNVSERQAGEERQAGGDSHLSGPVFPDIDDESELDAAPKAMVQHSVDGVIDYFA